MCECVLEYVCTCTYYTAQLPRCDTLTTREHMFDRILTHTRRQGYVYNMYMGGIYMCLSSGHTHKKWVWLIVRI